MVIQVLIKWINKNFPECSAKTERNSIHCNTLFVDAFQLYFNALENSDDEKAFISKYLGAVKNSIISNNPSDTIFVFLDGPCPAIRFQKLRERWFVSSHIEGFTINPNEFVLEESQSNEDGAHASLEKYLKRLINYDNVQAKSVIYSSVTTPGEAKYKYFDYFREMKSHPDFVPSRRHIILSNTNEMFFLALQFIDEKFYILKSNHVLYDIDLLRNFILYHMAIEEPFPGLYEQDPITPESQQKRQLQYQKIVSKMSYQLKQQIINDVVALSIVVSSENFAPFPEIYKMGTNAFTYAKLLNSYKELNQPFISSQINQNSDEVPEFTPLIVDNCFDLSSLRKIMTKFLQMYKKKNNKIKNKNDFQFKNKNSHKKSMNENDDEFKIKKETQKNKQDSESSTKKKKKSKKKNKKSQEERNIFDVGFFNNEENENENEKNDNDDDDYDDNNFNQSNDLEEENSVNLEQQQQEEQFESNNNEDEISDDNNNNNNSGDDDDDEFEFSESEVKDFPEESQQLFRLFNFTWQLYTRGCPSWSFYYQFKKSPPLEIALNLMHQEGLDVFDTEDANDVTEPMFKEFVIYPVDVDNIFPYCVYKLKIPPSPISKFWPLGATDPEDIPVIDLKLVKKYYRKAKKEMGQDPNEKVFPKTYEIVKKQQRSNPQRFSDESPFQKRYRQNVNLFDDF